MPTLLVSTVLQLEEARNRWEPLYERFRKHHPPFFKGSADPAKVEQWMSMINSILDFMTVEGNDRVACATYRLKEDVGI